MSVPPLRRLAPHVAIPAAVVALLAAIGPFGTFTDLTPAQRLLYWGAIVPLNWLQVEAAARVLMRRLSPMAAVAAASIVAAVPATAEVAVLESLLRPGLALPPLWLLYLFVAALTGGISVPVWIVRMKRPDERPPAPPAPPPEAAETLLSRLPARLGRDLLCLKTEDHYLRVFTPLGDALILMRLRDAEAALTGCDGARVHRSWWVARRAVAATRRDGERIFLDLVNGLAVPVSRSHVAALRRRGWVE